MPAHSLEQVTGQYGRYYSSASGAVKKILLVLFSGARSVLCSSRIVFPGIAQVSANHKLLRGVVTKIKMLKDQSRRTHAFVYEII